MGSVTHFGNELVKNFSPESIVFLDMGLFFLYSFNEFRYFSCCFVSKVDKTSFLMSSTQASDSEKFS